MRLIRDGARFVTAATSISHTTSAVELCQRQVLLIQSDRHWRLIKCRPVDRDRPLLEQNRHLTVLNETVLVEGVEEVGDAHLDNRLRLLLAAPIGDSDVQGRLLLGKGLHSTTPLLISERLGVVHELAVRETKHEIMVLVVPPKLCVDKVAVELDVLPGLAHAARAERGPIALVDREREAHHEVDPSSRRHLDLANLHLREVEREPENVVLRHRLLHRIPRGHFGCLLVVCPHDEPMHILKAPN